MTFIAFHAGLDEAEIATDTMSYTLNGSEFGRSSKVALYPHVDAAVMTQGFVTVGSTLRLAIDLLSEAVPTFDGMVEHLGAFLADAYAKLEEDIRAADARHGSTLFLIGYSEAEARFCAVQCATDRGFAVEPISDTFVHPSPWSLRPSALEADRIGRDVEAKEGRERRDAVLGGWNAQATPVIPESRQDWIALAMRARTERSLMSGFGKTFVAGDLHYTRLKRGMATTKKVHTFNDAGEEFQALVRGTYHPQGQLGPCWCGSGKTFLECHMAPHLDEPCACGSGRPIRDCCMVQVGEVERV